MRDFECRCLAASLTALLITGASVSSCGFADGEPIATGGSTSESTGVTGVPRATSDSGGGGDVSMSADGDGTGTSGNSGGQASCDCDDRADGERCLRFINACDETIWAGASGDDVPDGALDSVGMLAPGECRAVALQSVAGGRAWGGRDCGSGTCASSGASGRGTLVQFDLGGSDVYNVTLLGGFNIPMAMNPLGAEPTGDNACHPASCAADLNVVCPDGLSQVDNVGNATYCEHVCGACNACPQCNDCGMTASAACESCPGIADACCDGQGCEANEYSMLWKSLCPDAITYPSENASFACNQDTDFDVVFCP